MRAADNAWLVVLTLLVAAALLGPLFVGDTQLTVGPGYAPRAGDLPLGTDGLGRDVWRRLVAGGSGLLVVAALSTVAAMVVGVTVGLALTSRRRVVAALAVALNLLLVIPSMLTMMVLVFGLGSGVWTMVLIMCVASVPFVARFTRSVATPVLASDYVLAARAGGDGWPTVFLHEVLPNLKAPLLADAGARFIGSLYLVAAAGFLGFPPLGGDLDWATMVQSGLEGIRLNPWASLAPALAIAAITLPANLLVDRAMRRVLR